MRSCQVVGRRLLIGVRLKYVVDVGEARSGWNLATSILQQIVTGQVGRRRCIGGCIWQQLQQRGMLVAECSNRGRRRAQATASSEAGTVATGTAAVWIRLRGTASPRSTIPPADVGYRADKEYPIFNNSCPVVQGIYR